MTVRSSGATGRAASLNDFNSFAKQIFYIVSIGFVRYSYFNYQMRIMYSYDKLSVIKLIRIFDCFIHENRVKTVRLFLFLKIRPIHYVRPQINSRL